MRHFWADRRLIVIPTVLFLGVSLQPAYGQAKGGGSSPGGGAPGGSVGGSTGSIGSPTRGIGTFGNAPNSSMGNSPAMQHPIPLSGRVIFDDGTPPNHEIRIERVCAGNPHFEAYTDSKGRFSFQLNYNPMAALDLDVSDAASGPAIPGTQQNSGSNGFGSSPLSRSSPYWNCELRASYPGYRSDEVELASRRSLDDPNVGTLVLHRLANIKGSTISVTTALAPKRAQKDYQKGVELAQKEKFEDAEKHLQQATSEYPKFAAAWFALGEVEIKLNKSEDARKSFEAAIAADGKFVSPYDQLALLTGEQRKWEESANFSKQAIELNPVEFPSAFWYNAVANYNLKKIDDAQKSATELAKLDTRHHFPQVEHLLAQIYVDKANYPEAAAHLRTYLELVPNAKNADALKQDLQKLEQARADVKE
ncbi:MAG: tetratricopeptide repeat protein [Acidobacteriaceae bacterium]|nr:tetratricopeptide repeat protein [Acidobacteriaceae bacterium]